MKGGNQSLLSVSSLAQKIGTWTIIRWKPLPFFHHPLTDSSPWEAKQRSDWLVSKSLSSIGPLLPPGISVSLFIPFSSHPPLSSPQPLQHLFSLPSPPSLSLPPSLPALPVRRSQVLDQRTRGMIRSTGPRHVSPMRISKQQILLSLTCSYVS